MAIIDGKEIERNDSGIIFSGMCLHSDFHEWFKSYERGSYIHTQRHDDTTGLLPFTTEKERSVSSKAYTML